MNELKLEEMKRIESNYSKEELDEFYVCFCISCEWEGLSRDCNGGGEIGMSGDYDDLICPNCDEYSIDDF